MILADDIIAQAGTPLDLGSMLASMGRALEGAERFVLSDDVAKAGYQLITSRPSSLLGALPMCRAPYPVTWLEWNGNASTAAGWPFLAVSERQQPTGVNRENPVKMGCLVESEDKGQRGMMTWAWRMPGGGVSASALGVNFDYTGDVKVWGRAALAGRPDLLMVMDHMSKSVDDATLSFVMSNTLKWDKFANVETERAALRELGDHTMPWVSRHGWDTIDAIHRLAPNELPGVMRAWFGDICGECSFVDAMFLMMASKNAVEHEPRELGRLNKARAKSGKRPLLDHRITRLQLSRARARDAEASGMTRAEMRAHLVRGHFKLRKTGVYWWSPFVRGHKGTVERRHYEVRP